MADFTDRYDWEKRLARELSALNAKQLKRLLSLVGNPPDASRVPESFWREIENENTAVIKPALEKVFLESAQQLAKTVPPRIGVDWTLANEPAKKWANNYTFELVKGINDTSKERLQNTISGFFDKDVTMGDLKDAITPLFGSVRAEMIASTEVTRAAVNGELALVKQIHIDSPNIKMAAVWQTSNDEAVCPVCQPRNGRKLGDGWRDFPPAHPRCRCWINHEWR